MKNIQKILVIILCASVMFSTLYVHSVALEQQKYNQRMEEEGVKQAEIDLIFEELTDLALHQKRIDIQSKNEPYDVQNTLLSTSQINSAKTQYDDRLAELGVVKLDPENEEQMQAFTQMVTSSLQNQNETGTIARSLPDFSILVQAYSIYQYQGNYEVNNTVYPYSYVRVVDDKGYVDSKLTKSQLNNSLVRKEQTNIGALLEYTFSFGVSQYLGTLNYGWALDWTIGAVFSQLNNQNPNANVTYIGNNDIYTMGLISVTTMSYYYVNKPSTGWQMCGVRASNFALSRYETFMANVAGTPRTLTYTYPTTYSTTGTAWDGILRSYFSNGEQCLYYRLGYLCINGRGISTYFVPCFPETIVDLI